MLGSHQSHLFKRDSCFVFYFNFIPDSLVYKDVLCSEVSEVNLLDNVRIILIIILKHNKCILATQYFFNGLGRDQNVLFLVYFCFLNFRLVNQSVKILVVKPIKSNQLKSTLFV